MLINTPRLQIRPVTAADAADFFAYRSDPGVTKFQSYHFEDLEAATSHILALAGRTFGKKGEWVQMAICHIQDEKMVGDIGLKPEGYDERIVELGITLSASYQGQGIAREALSAVLGDLFRNHSIHRAIGYIDTENSASVKLFESLGFRREGRMLQSFNNKGVWRDEFLYAILSSEYFGDY